MSARVAPLVAGPSERLLRIRIHQEPPTEWSLIAGDFVQNVRAALDHLVWQLVLANGETPTPGNAFPIFSNRPSKDRGLSAMGADGHRARPARFRSGRELSSRMRDRAGKASVLAGLAELSNEDKHRLLLPSFLAVGRPSERPFEIGSRLASRCRRRRQAGRLLTESWLNRRLARDEARVRKVTGPTQTVKLRAALGLNVGFGRAPIAPFEALTQMRDVTAQIVARGGRIIRDAPSGARG